MGSVARIEVRNTSSSSSSSSYHHHHHHHHHHMLKLQGPQKILTDVFCASKNTGRLGAGTLKWIFFRVFVRWPLTLPRNEHTARTCQLRRPLQKMFPKYDCISSLRQCDCLRCSGSFFFKMRANQKGTLDFKPLLVFGCFQNNGTPKSSILIGFSIIFTIHFGVPLFLETPICWLVLLGMFPSLKLTASPLGQNQWQWSSLRWFSLQRMVISRFLAKKRWDFSGF